MPEIWNQAMTDLGQVMVVFGVAFSLLQCAFGYRLLKFWMGAIGFLIGFFLGFGISFLFVHENAYIPAAIGLISGIFCSWLVFRVYLAGVFVVCGILAFSAVWTIPVPKNSFWQIVLLIVSVFAFVTVGRTAVRLSKPFIIALTSITGAANAVHGLKAPLPVLAENPVGAWGAVAAIAAAGMAVQFLITAKKED